MDGKNPLWQSSVRVEQTHTKYLQNKEYLLEKILCVTCNKLITRININRHNESKLHLKILKPPKIIIDKTIKIAFSFGGHTTTNHIANHRNTFIHINYIAQVEREQLEMLNH